MSERKQRFLQKLVKAQEAGWSPKDKLLIPKLECLPDELFDPALDLALNKAEPKKDEPKKKRTPQVPALPGMGPLGMSPKKEPEKK